MNSLKIHLDKDRFRQQLIQTVLLSWFKTTIGHDSFWTGIAVNALFCTQVST